MSELVRDQPDWQNRLHDVDLQAARDIERDERKVRRRKRRYGGRRILFGPAVDEE